ncbi:MAG: exo-beta-N-acetylmuramidase NamZ domain-containing protein, partial [Sandaracinaceae bacterium]
WDVGRTAMRDGSVGHGGFTGTLLAIDPERDQFVVFLSNRVHPDGGRRGELTGFFRELLPLLAGALERSDAVPEPRVRTGLDVLARERFAPIVGSHVALLTHDPARSVDGRRAIDVLLDAPDVELVRVLAPEHGLGADREGRIRDGRDARTGIPVRALFGPTRTPDDAMLEGVDTIVVDLVAVGVRFYTYASTVVRVLEAAAPRGLRVVILDRPEPLGGGRPRGPVSEPALASFVSYHPLPAYHGMTLGEVARLVNDERGIGAHLEVIGPDGWTRTPWGETGLRWFAPSPNLPTLEAVELYPALALIEGTNVSVGRGTDAPFARLGAPFIDPRRLIAEVGTIDGVAIEPVTFVPRSARHRRVRCRGVALRVVDRARYDPIATGLRLAAALHRAYPDEWDAAPLERMLGRHDVYEAFLRGADEPALEALWQGDLEAFAARRARYVAASPAAASPAAGSVRGEVGSGH